MTRYIRSPIFYMGNKYKLLKNIEPLFPNKIDTFYDLFGGSGVVSINMSRKANKVVYNDFNGNITKLLEMFKTFNPEELNEYFEQKKKDYGLRTFSVNSYDRINLKEKAYKEIEDGYLRLREYYNKSEDKDYRILYLLSCYSINHLMRFNSNDEFNVSVGADSYSPKIYNLIKYAHKALNNICINNKDIFDFDFSSITENDFVYLDPPYLNTLAVYNESRAYGGWSIEDDYKLFDIIDNLDSRNIKFGLSNVYTNRDIENTHLINWVESKGYSVYHFDKTYNPFSTENSNSDEVYITNVYRERYENISLF